MLATPRWRVRGAHTSPPKHKRWGGEAKTTKDLGGSSLIAPLLEPVAGARQSLHYLVGDLGVAVSRSLGASVGTPCGFRARLLLPRPAMPLPTVFILPTHILLREKKSHSS